MHSFDGALQLTRTNGDRFAGKITSTYANMVGPFGGITNALMLNAILLHPERRGEPVSLTVNFAGPIADGAFEIEASPSRTNRSTQHWSVTMTQGGEIATTATAVFAERRESWSAQEAVMPIGLPQPADLPRMPAVGMPGWIARYDMRFVDGGLALDGQEQPDSVSRLWIRDDPPRPLTFTSLASMCDCFYPRVFLRRHRLVPAGTVSMTTYFHADASLLGAQSDRYLFGVARGLNFRSGYFDQSAEIWSHDGHILASSHQVVYFRD